MKKKLFGAMGAAVMALSIAFSSTAHVSAAPVKITVDEEEYNLYVEDTPSDLGSVYAKFNSKKSNVDTYSLSLWDDTEAAELMEAALAKSGMKAEDYYMIAATVQLFQEDDEGDEYEVTTTIPMTLICELPTEYEGVEDKLKIYMLKTDGKVEAVPYTLVDVDDYICAQFTVSRFTTYAFMVSNADIEAYEEALYGDDGDDNDGDEDDTTTPAPTKKPAATSTPAPTKAGSTGNQRPSTGGSSGVKDSVPKTGDDFSTAGTGIALLLAGSALTGLLLYAKKK